MNAAATFSRTAPGLGADETLVQRGRIASVDVLKGSEKDIRKMQVRLPEVFLVHQVKSSWRLGESNPIHEIRTIRSVDDVPTAAVSNVRHALTLQPQSPDDTGKKALLEDLEAGTLEGAALDFAPILLLFTEAHKSNYSFKLAGVRWANTPDAMLVLRYRQIGGDGVFTEFRDRSEQRHPAQGEIWLRQSDLLPLKVTLITEEVLSVHYILRNEAEVNYTPTPYGLAPSTVIHQQFLNQDLLVQNRFRYSDYSGRQAIP